MGDVQNDNDNDETLRELTSGYDTGPMEFSDLVTKSDSFSEKNSRLPGNYQHGRYLKKKVSIETIELCFYLALSYVYLGDFKNKQTIRIRLNFHIEKKKGCGLTQGAKRDELWPR